MRLIQNMCTIAEYPAAGSAAAADYCLGPAGRRLVKIAVVGASGVGKTGESALRPRAPSCCRSGDPSPRRDSQLRRRGERWGVAGAHRLLGSRGLGRDLSRLRPSASTGQGDRATEWPGSFSGVTGAPGVRTSEV